MGGSEKAPACVTFLFTFEAGEAADEAKGIFPYKIDLFNYSVYWIPLFFVDINCDYLPKLHI